MAGVSRAHQGGTVLVPPESSHMPSHIRQALLERAREELGTLSRRPDPGYQETEAHRQRLELLIDHLTAGILSPPVLDAAASSRRGPVRS